VNRHKPSEPSTSIAPLIPSRPSFTRVRDRSLNYIANARIKHSPKERAPSELDRQRQIRQTSTDSLLRIDQQDQVPRESCGREQVRDCATIELASSPRTRLRQSPYFRTVLLR
jgi:hypothetical protein